MAPTGVNLVAYGIQLRLDYAELRMAPKRGLD